MDKPIIHEKRLTSALCQFIFPFSLNPGTAQVLAKQLSADGYEPFYLNNLDLEDAYYGEGYRVSHQKMDRYYLPFTGSVLFPHEMNAESFQRYSRRFDLDGVLKTRLKSTGFLILSADVILCPFDLGFITIRTRLNTSDLTYTSALEFASRFRVLQDVSEADKSTFLLCEGKEYEEIEDFIFKKLTPSILPFLDRSELEGTYFETMPFFVDERMYVQSFFSFEEGAAIDPEDQYRAARLDGMDPHGKAFISSSNLEYIKRHCERHVYDRWTPHTFYITDENSFCCLTSERPEYAVHIANTMYGEYYYGLLLNLFHKIVLLKLSKRYSLVRLEQNQRQIEDLIRDITTFSAKYFFLELVTQSQGREIFIQLRKLFGNSGLYDDVKQTLADLFKYQDNYSSKRAGYLLMVLTIYTVISGIYGMNQVIEDLKGPINWSKFEGYSLFEWIAVFIAFTGIAVGFSLIITTLTRFGKDWWRKRAKKRA